MGKYSLIACLSVFALGCVGAPVGVEGEGAVSEESALQLAQKSKRLSSAQVRQLVTDYYIDVRGLNLGNYVANFAKHGTLEDPAGTPPARGQSEIAATYQQAVDSFSILDMREMDVFTPDQTNEAAVRWQATLKFKNGLIVDAFNGISYFKFNGDGKIDSLRAFWDPSVMAGAHF